MKTTINGSCLKNIYSKHITNFISCSLLFFFSFSLAQVTEIYVSSEYGFANGNWSPGGTTPFYQKDGYVYCISRKQNVNEGKIFKIDQSTNAVTLIQEDKVFGYDIPYHIGDYGNKVIFLNGNRTGSNVLDVTSNTYVPSYFYGGSSVALYNGYLYSGSQKKNLDTGVSSSIGTYTNANNQMVTLIFYYITVIGNDLYGFQYESVPGLANPITNKIFKMKNNASPVMIYNSVNKSIQPVGSEYLSKVNGKLIFTQLDNSGTNHILQSIPEDGGNAAELLAPTAGGFLSKLIYQNQFYFSDTNSINTKKTDGTSVFASGLSVTNIYGSNRFSSKYLPFSNFVEYNGNMYSCRYGTNSAIPRYFIKFNGTSETLLHQFQEMQGACIYNNRLYFSASFLDGNNNFINGIFYYDGTDIYRLNLGTISGKFVSQSIFCNNNFLFFGNDKTLVKIDLNTVQSTLVPSNLDVHDNLVQSVIKFYPNPTKSTLNFSQELSAIKITDMSGKQVFSNQEKTKNISVEKLPKGNYIITGKDKNGKNISEKFIKK